MLDSGDLLISAAYREPYSSSSIIPAGMIHIIVVPQHRNVFAGSHITLITYVARTGSSIYDAVRLRVASIRSYTNAL